MITTTNEAATQHGLQVKAPTLRIGRQVREYISSLLISETTRWERIHPGLGDVFESICDFLQGGKQLRAHFCYLSFVGAGGQRDDPTIVSLCAALELLHSFAVIQDDVMDGS